MSEVVSFSPAARRAPHAAGAQYTGAAGHGLMLDFKEALSPAYASDDAAEAE